MAEWTDITPKQDDQWVDITPTEQASQPQAAPVPEELPFSQRVMLALVQGENSKKRYLETEYGKENVEVRPDGIFVNDNGKIIKAETGIGAELLAQGPEMLGGTVGRAVGGFAGFLTPVPGGAFIGAVTGGGVGSAIAHVIKNKGLEALGIRSQEDAETALETITKDTVANIAIDAALSNPIVRNMAIVAGATVAGVAAATAPEGERGQAALSAAIPAAALGAGAGSVVAIGKGIKSGAVGRTLAKTWTSGLRALSEDEMQNAEFLRAVTPGTKSEDWQTLLRSQEDAQAIKASMQSVIKYNKQKLAGKTVEAIDPAASEMIKRSQALMEGVKKRASDQFQEAKDLVSSSPGARGVRVDVDAPAAEFRRGLNDLGVLTADADGRAMIRRTVDPSGQSIAQVYSEGDLRALDQVLRQLEAFQSRPGLPEHAVDRAMRARALSKQTGPSGTAKIGTDIADLPKQITFDEAIKTRQLIDGILEKNGYFNQGDHAIGTQASRLLQGLRANLMKSTQKELGDIDVLIDGKRKSAGEIFRTANAKYSSFRDVYDTFALPSKLGDPTKALDTVERMLGAKGDSVEGAFSDMLKNVGINAPKEIARLQQLRAARNLSHSVSASTGPLNIARAKLGLNPRDLATATADRAQKRFTPIDSRTGMLVQAVARGNTFVQGMTKEEKRQMLTTPALRTFLQTIYGSLDQFDQTQQALMGGQQ